MQSSVFRFEVFSNVRDLKVSTHYVTLELIVYVKLELKIKHFTT
jgi:hypothetical protein